MAAALVTRTLLTNPPRKVCRHKGSVYRSKNYMALILAYCLRYRAQKWLEPFMVGLLNYFSSQNVQLYSPLMVPIVQNKAQKLLIFIPATGLKETLRTKYIRCHKLTASMHIEI